MRCRSLSIWTLCLFIIGCTPKVTEETTTVKPPEKTEPEIVENYPCITWTDKPFQEEAETAYVLYRDFLRQKDYDQSFVYWKDIYEMAPKADGKRKTVFEDGIRLYKHFYEQSQDEEEKKGYVQRIMRIHDQIGECYESGDYAAGRKAFDYYFSFREHISGEDLFLLFKQYVDAYGEKSNYFVVNPFSALLVEEYFKENGFLTKEDAQKYAYTLLKVTEAGLANCENEKDCEPWEIVNSYAPERLADFERVRGFYPCGYYTNRYSKEFEENPDNCDVIETLMIRYRWAGCDQANTAVAPVIGAYNEHCKPEPGCMTVVKNLLQEGKYSESIDQISKCIEQTDDQTKKGTYALFAAKIYYAHLKNFSNARSWAEKAAAFRPDWGEPFILIGKLYASSGPRCGSGRGWDSQRVAWVAVDEFQKAKRIDPSVSQEANKWINYYCKFFPSGEDIHLRMLNKGQDYFVPCWIQRSTIVREPCD